MGFFIELFWKILLKNNRSIPIFNDISMDSITTNISKKDLISAINIKLNKALIHKN